MAENDVVRFPGNLDPSAQEFRPTFIPHHHNFPFSPPPQQPPFFPEFLYSPPPPPQHPPLSFMTPALLPPSIPPPASSPTRALLLTAVPPDVSESIVRRELEIFGDVRAVQMGRVSEGIVTVHFYDLRAAHAALDAVREQHMQHQNRLRLHYSSILARTNSGPFVGPPPTPPPSPGLVSGRAVWAQFTIPATNAFPDGAVKELRETPMKRQQRFVEFYDVRDASRALVEMNGKEINGRSVMIEFSRPGGHSNKKFNNHFNHNFNQSPNLNYHHQQQQHIIKQPIPSPAPPSSVFPLRNRRTSPKQNVRRRRSSPMSSEESLDVAMTGLTLRGNGGNTKPNGSGSNCGATRKGGKSRNSNGNCSSSDSSSTTSIKQQPQQGQSSTGGSKAKPWKGRQKNFDPRFLIKEEAIVDDESGCKDTRTTIMIKNIPNKYR
uniref:RRM domain-containing protein n=1 Tax=Chenopodium quinoa TaxID=63459 RepID=A0A803M6Z4_CHEQI